MRWRSHARDFSAPQGRAAANVIRFGISFAARSIAGKMVGNGVRGPKWPRNGVPVDLATRLKCVGALRGVPAEVREGGCREAAGVRRKRRFRPGGKLSPTDY